MGEAYRSEAAWVDRRPGALVLACSDGRFDAALDEFCAQRLGIAGYDRLFIPGGVQVLREGSLLPKFEWAGRRFLRFLLDKHELKRLICVGHEGCAWYAGPTWGPEAQVDPLVRQRRDLEAVSGDLAALRAEVRVEAYLARPAEGRVAFESVRAA